MAKASEQTTEPTGRSRSDEEPSAAIKLYVVEKVAEARKHSVLVFGGIAVVLSLLSALGALQSARSYIDDQINKGHLKSLEEQAAKTLRDARANAAAVGAARSEAEKQLNLVQTDANKFAAIVDARIKLYARKESLVASLSHAKKDLAAKNKIEPHWRTDADQNQIAKAKKTIEAIELELEQLKQQGIE
jgi:hypothetical protein